MEPSMQADDPLNDLPSHRAALSALMDGDGGASDEACRAWRGGADARADWHVYHLIGDALRSDEHRCDAAHDARFLHGLRERLAAEPVPMAPMAFPAAAGRARRTPRWMAPAAVAAGFVAVAGVLGVTRLSLPDGAASERNALAGAPAAAEVQRVGARAGGGAASAALELAPTPDLGPLIRNAELDRYLAAHRQFANAAALTVPGGVVRSATVAAPGR
jgi:sigma-E factor negative regulatory protein RseA